MVARRDDVGGDTRRPAIRGRARHASRMRHAAPTRSPARRLFTIFSRFLAFMFSTCRFATRSRRVTQCPSSFVFFVLIGHVLIVFFFFCLLLCRFILYGLRAHALRLSGCWVSVRRSMSSSYFDRVAILTDIFFWTNVGQKSFSFHLFTLLPLPHTRALNCNCSVG